MKTFKRINRRTSEQVVGPWHEIADLDVRIWTYAEEVVAFLNSEPITRKETPYVNVLASVLVPPESNFEGPIWRDIYSLDDLVGLHI